MKKNILTVFCGLALALCCGTLGGCKFEIDIKKPADSTQNTPNNPSDNTQKPDNPADNTPDNPADDNPADEDTPVTPPAETKNDYDLSQVSFANKTVDYNGEAQTLTLSGTLPQGLSVAYKYYTDATRTTEAASVVDAGTYYVTATFTNSDSTYNTPANKEATLTINKVNYSNVVLTLKAKNMTTNAQVTALDNGDGTFYIETSGDQYREYEITNNVNATQKVTYYMSYDATNNTYGMKGQHPIKDLGSTQHFVVTLNGDKNHNEMEIKSQVSITKKTFAISTFEDLKIVYKHIYENNVDKMVRNQARYLLLNDIDGQGAVWTVPGSQIQLASIDDHNVFYGEFNGQGHTIKNLKITEASIKDNGTDKTDFCVGFFGYTNSAYIHDVNFENINIEIKKGTITTTKNEGAATITIYGGIVAGRLECGVNFNYDWDPNATIVTKVNKLENINVKNCNINIDGYKQFVGLVTGYDVYQDGDAGYRKNINVENCNAFATDSVNGQKVRLGGVVGHVEQTSKGLQLQDKLLYENITVKNVKLGFDYASWNNADADKKADYLMKEGSENKLFVGGFMGELTTTEVTINHVAGNVVFNNCKLENYLIATTNTAGTSEFYGECNDRALELTTLNITKTQDETWNGGVNGYYRTTGKVENLGNN